VVTVWVSHFIKFEMSLNLNIICATQMYLNPNVTCATRSDPNPNIICVTWPLGWARPRCMQASNPGTHWIGVWVGLTAGLDTEARRKILFLCWGSNPGHPACSQAQYKKCKSHKYKQKPYKKTRE
jgi:hypothetical protein